MPALAPWSAAAVKMMPRIGPAHGAHSRPVATPSRADDQTLSFSPGWRFGQARPERDQRPGHAVGNAREDQRDAEQSKQHQRRPAADRIGADRPAAADRGEGRDDRERSGHSGQQRQSAAHEAAVGAREHERQHRQDARAEDGQDAAQIGEQDDQHFRASPLTEWPAPSSPDAATDTAVEPDRMQAACIQAPLCPRNLVRSCSKAARQKRE